MDVDCRLTLFVLLTQLEKLIDILLAKRLLHNDSSALGFVSGLGEDGK